MQGVETVHHLAALLSSPENPSRFKEVNVEGTRNVLRAAEASGVRHFVFISSISVTYPRPNPYSASKAAAEERVRNARISWTIVRPCLVLDGVGGGEEYRAFAAAVRKSPVVLLPCGGAALKRPVHAEDVCEALGRLSGNPIAFGKTYALGGADTVSLREMAKALLRASHRRKAMVPVPLLPLRGVAIGLETLSRITGRRFSRFCRQSLDGLVFDAAPETQPVLEDLNFAPRGIREFDQWQAR